MLLLLVLLAARARSLRVHPHNRRRWWRTSEASCRLLPLLVCTPASLIEGEVRCMCGWC
jgi:hypothetical protein